MRESDAPKQLRTVEVCALLMGFGIIAVYLYRFRDLIARALELAGLQ